MLPEIIPTTIFKNIKNEFEKIETPAAIFFLIFISSVVLLSTFKSLSILVLLYH